MTARPATSRVSDGDPVFASVADELDPTAASVPLSRRTASVVVVPPCAGELPCPGPKDAVVVGPVELDPGVVVVVVAGPEVVVVDARVVVVVDARVVVVVDAQVVVVMGAHVVVVIGAQVVEVGGGGQVQRVSTTWLGCAMAVPVAKIKPPDNANTAMDTLIRKLISLHFVLPDLGQRNGTRKSTGNEASGLHPVRRRSLLRSPLDDAQ